MIRVAYLIDTLSCATSGTEKQLLEIIKRLDREKFQVCLICLYESPWMRDNALPCPCFVLGYRGLLKWNIFQVIRELHNILRKQNIQILQTFFEDSIFVAWLARQRSENTVLLSSRRDMGLGEGNQPWYHRLYGLALPLVNRNFDGIIANSTKVREYVVQREKTAIDKIEVIYNGVDFVQPPPSAPAVFKQHSDACWVAMVASLNPVKRHDLLIRAISLLKGKIKKEKLRVLLLGKGPLSDKLQAMVARQGLGDFFLFKGAVPDVTDYLQSCDIGVLCSDREGLSNAILEYMVCGLPVIATAVGGNTELVDDTNGLCIPPGDPEALADALHELIQDREKRRELGLASRRKAEQYFSWERSMQQLEKYYEMKLQQKGIAND